MEETGSCYAYDLKPEIVYFLRINLMFLKDSIMSYLKFLQLLEFLLPKMNAFINYTLDKCQLLYL